MKITLVGVDIAKSVFYLHVVDWHWQQKLKRSEYVNELCQKVPVGAIVAMEACASAHHCG
jgi:transposase